MVQGVGDGRGSHRSGDRRDLPGIDCDEAVRQLYHYLDGELTDARRQRIAVHLDECAPCAHAAGFEAELRSVIASRCRDRVPDMLIERVAAAIDAEAFHQVEGHRQPPLAGG